MPEENVDQREAGASADGVVEERGHMEADEQEAMQRLQEEIGRLSVADHVLLMMHSLSSLAVGWMGLAPEAAERKDLGQARLAIDAFKALLGVLEGKRPAEELTAHRSVLSQLQMAYVGALGPVQGGNVDSGGSGGHGGEEGASGAGGDSPDSGGEGDGSSGDSGDGEGRGSDGASEAP